MSMMYPAQPEELGMFSLDKRCRGHELPHGGRISFAPGGLGGASDLWGDTTVEELSAQNR